MWQDILRAAETGKSHYLDTITRFKSGPENEYITDGQQRLVSILLLAMAILHVLKNKEFKIKNESRRKFFISYAEKMVYSHPFSTNGKPVLKIALNEDDLTVIREVEKNDPDAVQENVNPAVLEESHIYKNYKFFRRTVERFLQDKKYDLGDIFSAIDNMEVNIEDCPIGKAQVTYSNKNSKGLPMTQADLVKNTLMYMFPLEEQKDIYKNYWLAMERNVYRRNIEEFITDAMAVINTFSETVGKQFAWDEKNNLMQNVYDYLRIMADKSEKNNVSVRPEDSDKLMPKESQQVLEALLDLSDIYKRYITDVKNYKQAAADPLTEKVYQFERVLGGKKAMSVVLYLLKQYELGNITKKVTINCMDTLVTLQMRNKFVGQFKGVQRKPSIQLMREMNERKNKHMDDFMWNTLVNKTGTQGIASDKSLIEYFTNSQLSSGFGNTAKNQKLTTRFLFWRINEAYAKEHRKKILGFNENLAVEHVIPPSNETAWKNELNETSAEKIKGIVDRLGNHALVLKPSDNDGFSKKKKIYKGLQFPLTAAISKYNNYTEKEVDAITAIYAEYFIKAFPIPERYNKDSKLLPKAA